MGFSFFLLPEEGNSLLISHTAMSRTFVMESVSTLVSQRQCYQHSLPWHISQFLELQCSLHLCTFACVNPSLPSLMGIILQVSAKAPCPSENMAYSLQVKPNRLYRNQGAPSVPDFSLLCQNVLCCCKLCRQWSACIY